MSTLIVVVASTLDGYAAGEGGNVFVMPLDLGFDRYNLERMRDAETVLFGAASFHGARHYWPPLADAESAPGVEREIARIYQRIHKVVVSDTLNPSDTAPWSDTTEVVRRVHARNRVAELRERNGGDVVVFGSFSVWHDLLAADLVDELHLLVGPGVIGGGLRTFPDVEQRFGLLDVQRLDDSELVALRYATSH